MPKTNYNYIVLHVFICQDSYSRIPLAEFKLFANRPTNRTFEHGKILLKSASRACICYERDPWRYIEELKKNTGLPRSLHQEEEIKDGACDAEEVACLRHAESWYLIEEGQLYPTLRGFVDQSVANEWHRSRSVFERCGCKECISISIFHQSGIRRRDGALGTQNPERFRMGRYLRRGARKLSVINCIFADSARFPS